MTRHRFPRSTSKFEEQVAKEASDYFDALVKRRGHASRHWEHGKPPKHQQKRAPVWIERARGHTSLCRICVGRIKKGTIRFGTNSPNPYGWQAYYWHPECFTAQVLKEFSYAEELELEEREHE